jgi:hypothetical protein
MYEQLISQKDEKKTDDLNNVTIENVIGLFAQGVAVKEDVNRVNIRSELSKRQPQNLII